MASKRPPLDEQKSLWEATVAAEGITTGAGAADGKSIVDAGLAGSGANSFFSMLMVLYPGQPRLVDSMDITGFTNGTGEVIFSPAYKGIAAAIPAGVPYKIVTFRFVPAEVAALAASLGLMADAATADDLSDVTTTSAHAKLRRLLLRMSGAGIFSADIQGLARTELDTMLAQLAIYFNTAGAALSVVSQPGVAARTTLNAILTDLADILAGATGITNFPGPAAPANDVSLAEVLHQIYDDVVAINSAKPNVQEVVIYPVAEDAGLTELVDDGSAPAFYPAAAHSTNVVGEGAAVAAWSEDINFEQEGTINIISIFAEFEWQTQFLIGAGNGVNSVSKIQISRDGGANWVDLTDNFINPNAAMTTRNRAGVGLWIPTIVAGANQLQFRLVHWVDVGNDISTSKAQIRSNSFVRITYRKS